MLKRIKQLNKLKKSSLSEDEYYKQDGSGRGIIDVGAENYDDILSYYDLEGENVLDREFDEFLRAKAEAIPIKKELSLHFHVRDANKDKKEEIDKVIKNHYKRELKALNRDLKQNLKFTLYMLFMGLVAFGIYAVLYLNNINFMAVYIFDLIGYVFLWEVVDNHFLERKKLNDERIKIYRFIRADIHIYEYKKKSKKTSKKKIKDIQNVENRT